MQKFIVSRRKIKQTVNLLCHLYQHLTTITQGIAEIVSKINASTRPYHESSTSSSYLRNCTRHTIWAKYVFFPEFAVIGSSPKLAIYLRANFPEARIREK